MKIRISDLWSWEGTIDRGAYAFWAVGLAVLKFNLDRVLIARIFGRSLHPFEYWQPGEVFGPFSSVVASYVLPFVLLALPFVWAGMALTIRRLRAAQLHPALALFFFVPLINVLLFAVLCALPTIGPEPETDANRSRGGLGRLIPESRIGSAAVAVAITVPIVLVLTYLFASVLGTYGWGLFVGLPVFLGLSASILHGYHQARSLWSCFAVALIAVVILSALMLGLAIEGGICILMAAPIGGVLALLGAFLGWMIQRRPNAYGDAGRVMGALIVCLPGVMSAEHELPAEPPLIAVKTAIVIDAPPEAVWRNVIAFAEMPPPDDWLFRAGVAYPLRAEIHGSGVGAVRHCVFSTGPFVEPIEVWDEPRLLKFAVTAQPPAMSEMSPWNIHPPHLDDYLVSKGGQFLLEPLADGTTRLEGTTWYTHKIAPSSYWRRWSDLIIHKIHTRVLEHIKRQTEG